MARIRKRIFVGCEGESERSYVRWIQDRADEMGRAWHFDSHKVGGGDPLAVVEGSIKRMKLQVRKFGPYHAMAVLLDSDLLGRTPARDARIPVAAADATLLYQEYDHEALLLRHFNGCDQLRPQRGRSRAALLRIWPDYKKGSDAISLGRKLDVAALQRMLNVEPDFKAFFDPLLSTNATTSTGP